METDNLAQSPAFLETGSLRGQGPGLYHKVVHLYAVEVSGPVSRGVLCGVQTDNVAQSTAAITSINVKIALHFNKHIDFSEEEKNIDNRI